MFTGFTSLWDLPIQRTNLEVNLDEYFVVYVNVEELLQNSW